jgi:hypothetical protein
LDLDLSIWIWTCHKLFKYGKGGFYIFTKSTPWSDWGEFNKNIKSTSVTPWVDLVKILNPPHGAYGVDLRSPLNILNIKYT